MGTGLGYWEITTTDADVEAGYKETYLKFSGYLCDMPDFIRKHTDCPFYRLDLWSVELDCYRRHMKPRHLGTVEEYLMEHD